MSKIKVDSKYMMTLDLYLSEGEKHKLDESQATHPPSPIYPLKSMDIYCNAVRERMIKAQKEQDKLKLMQFYGHYNWFTCPEMAMDFEYDALVLTDCSQTIEWVNKGFTTMTGYPSKYALGKKPSFLQGKNTCKDVKHFIRKQLLTGDPFTASILNYRKNNEEYLCEINLFPLKDKMNNTTHFLAVERELVMD